MEKSFCQSCGMPMEDANLYGTEANGTKSADYCSYCYKEGAFTSDMNMDDMIELCVPMMAQANADITEQQAREGMQQFFPTLKRWAKK